MIINNVQYVSGFALNDYGYVVLSADDPAADGRHMLGCIHWFSWASADRRRLGQWW